MTCPNCQQGMLEQTLAGHVGASITIDACMHCQMFWFDARESPRLAPASTLRLFRLIGEGTSSDRRPIAPSSRCPRCDLTLRLVHDVQRSTRFTYRKCPRGHGRLVTFFDFLREKDFITPMSPAQIEELRRNVATVNCSNCGAPIELHRESTCSHCGSALSLIDADRTGTLLDALRAADRAGQPVDPALPLRLEQARRDAERVFADRGDGWYRDASASGTVLAGLHAFVRWLSRS